MDEELLSRQPPQSLEAEQSVLGSILIDSRCVADVIGIVKPEDFYLRQHGEIFETLYHLFVYSRPIDGVTVAGELEKNGIYTEATRPYLVQLMEVTPTSANVGEYVRLVREKALLRQVAMAASDITARVQSGGGDATETLESAEQKVYAIRRGRSGQGGNRVGGAVLAALSRGEQDLTDHGLFPSFFSFLLAPRLNLRGIRRVS